jgi:hypothetical protein
MVGELTSDLACACLTDELASSAVKGSVIATPPRNLAIDMIDGFNEREFQTNENNALSLENNI